MKVLIFGASGSGTTTLGKKLEQRTGYIHLDADDYYWKVTNPPYQEKIPLVERNKKLTIDFEKHNNVIVSGSMVSWGKQWEKAFDLAVFLYLDNEIRMKRLEKREIKRYGNTMISNKQIQQNSKAFLEWAKKYDDPNFTGRSLKIHNNWIQLLDCPVLRINGEKELEDKIKKVLQEIRTFN